MTQALYYLVYSAVLTWISFMMGTTFRNRLWTPKGLMIGMGNRDNVPPPSALSARADRAATNTLEGFVTFAALVLTAHVAGVENEQVVLGAKLFFFARLVYLPLYYAGVPIIRSAVWLVGVIAQIMILLVLW